MCGRYTTNTEDELIEIRDILNDIAIKITNEEGIYLNKEVTPGSLAPVITKEKELKILKWGFIKWDNKGLIFNARSESIMSSKYFSPYIKNNRCVIPASNYFEWEHVDKVKKKYEIHDVNKNVIFFAGIIKIEDDSTESYTILTKEANENIEFIHNRMPVILEASEVDDWLNGLLQPNEIKSNLIDLDYKLCNDK